MDAVDLEIAAQILTNMRVQHEPVENLPGPAQPQTLDEAYAIQERLHDMLSDSGLGAVGGHKIGCTTQVMQAYLKIDTPCAGKVMGATVFHEEGRYRRDQLTRPGVECEIAVRLDRDMPARNGGYDQTAAAQCVGACMASIELVDERWVDFTKLPAPLLVADDFFNAGCVLGVESSMDPLHLDSVAGRMNINGEQIGEGVGSDILGHPMTALAWLANLRADQGIPLLAGEFVTLGSIVKTKWIEAGDRVDMAIDGLGSASLTVE